MYGNRGLPVDWIREHFALLMLIGVLSLMLVGLLAVHWPGQSNPANCPDSRDGCPTTTR